MRSRLRLLYGFSYRNQCLAPKRLLTACRDVSAFVLLYQKIAWADARRMLSGVCRRMATRLISAPDSSIR